MQTMSGRRKGADVMASIAGSSIDQHRNACYLGKAMTEEDTQ